MRYVSLFSVIEAASVAWEPLGWEPVAFAEIEPFPCKLLQTRWPKVPNLGDVTQITLDRIAELGHVDVVIFGSPCQDLSLAGHRKGLDGERSGLFFDAMRIVTWLRWYNGLRWALWENVPGAFSSNEGRDFGVVVGAMAGCNVDVPRKGWGSEGALVGQEAMVEWSTLDAQWFGVAQRRRRVFALADFGDWASRPPVLLEPDRVRGSAAPSRPSWEDAAGGLADCAGTLSVNAGPRSKDAGNFTSNQGVASGYVIPCVSNAEGTLELPYLTVSNLSKQFNNQQPLVFDYANITHPRNMTRVEPGLPSGTLNSAAQMMVALQEMGLRDTADPITANEAKTYTHEGMTFRMRNVVPSLNAYEWRVRRLIPLECERLQGFPDGHTDLGKDAPRYKALGNSMAVPVINWIGRSIAAASLDIWQ